MGLILGVPGVKVSELVAELSVYRVKVSDEHVEDTPEIEHGGISFPSKSLVSYSSVEDSLKSISGPAAA